jgi:hypothetical protein
MLRHDRWLSALAPNKSLSPASPRLQFAAILSRRNSLLSLWYISDFAVRLSPPSTPLPYRIQIA